MGTLPVLWPALGTAPHSFSEVWILGNGRFDGKISHHTDGAMPAWVAQTTSQLGTWSQVVWKQASWSNPGDPLLPGPLCSLVPSQARPHDILPYRNLSSLSFGKSKLCEVLIPKTVIPHRGSSPTRKS